MKTNIIKPKYEEEERKNEKCRIEKQSEEELGCFKRSHRRTKKISLNAQPGLMERRRFLKNFIGEKEEVIKIYNSEKIIFSMLIN